jgi:hypothetical protein
MRTLQAFGGGALGGVQPGRAAANHLGARMARPRAWGVSGARRQWQRAF